MDYQVRTIGKKTQWYMQTVHGLQLQCGSQSGGTTPDGKPQNPFCAGSFMVNGIQVGCQLYHDPPLTEIRPHYVPITHENQIRLRNEEIRFNAERFGVPQQSMRDMLSQLKHPRSMVEFYKRIADVTGAPLEEQQHKEIAADKAARENFQQTRRLQAFQANGYRPRSRSRSPNGYRPRSRSPGACRNRSRSPCF